MTANIDTVRAGLDAYKRGDLDAVGELLAEDVRWEGVGGVEPCVNRDETLAALAASADTAKGLELADAVPFGTDKVMVCLVRLPGAESEADDEQPSRLYNVITFSGEKVARMQGFLGRKEAVQAARGAGAGTGGNVGASGGDKANGGRPPRKRSLWRRLRMGAGRIAGRG